MEILPFFEKLGFPIAVCAVLFGVILYGLKNALQMLRDYLKASQEQSKIQQEQEDKRTEQLISIIKEQSSVITANTTAMNNFSLTIGKLSSVIEKSLNKQ